MMNEPFDAVPGAPAPALIVSVSPDTCTVGTWVTLRVRLTPTRPLEPGASVKVQLPRSWHVWYSNGAKGVHSIDPTAPNYVSLQSVTPDLGFDFEVEGGSTAERVTVNTRYGIDGRQHRYNYVARIDVRSGVWSEGDPIEVVFGDQSLGSTGFQAAFHPQGPEPVLVSVAEHESDDYKILPTNLLPHLTAQADLAVELIAALPTIAVSGETSELHITALDHLHNPTSWPGDVSFDVVEGRAVIATSLPAPTSPTVRVPLVPSAAGTLRIEVSSGGLSIRSNPSGVSAVEPADRVYWGDLHVHSNESYDGTGHHPFEYGRDVMGLDFMALTDHCEEWPTEVWQSILARNEDHLDAGRFVTIPAYEGTFDGPHGHHNVYLRSGDGPVIGNDRGTVVDIWNAARRGEAITVPHHTGITWGTAAHLRKNRSQPHVDWTIHNAEFRRLVEIYSSHGQCETYDPDHPLAYENITDFSNATSSPGPNWAQDGWLEDCVLGTVGGSDNHASQAGRCHTGLTAVLAPELTRDAVFDAMWNRRTYATTGARVLLDFRIGDQQMGGRIAQAELIEGSVRAVGTADIDVVEVLRGDIERRSLNVLSAWQPTGAQFSTTWEDTDPPLHGFYYTRLRQRGEMHGRIVMAWSSPIWLGTPPVGTPE